MENDSSPMRLARPSLQQAQSADRCCHAKLACAMHRTIATTGHRYRAIRRPGPPQPLNLNLRSPAPTTATNSKRSLPSPGNSPTARKISFNGTSRSTTITISNGAAQWAPPPPPSPPSQGYLAVEPLPPVNPKILSPTSTSATSLSRPKPTSPVNQFPVPFDNLDGNYLLDQGGFAPPYGMFGRMGIPLASPSGQAPAPSPASPRPAVSPPPPAAEAAAPPPAAFAAAAGIAAAIPFLANTQQAVFDLQTIAVNQQGQVVQRHLKFMEASAFGAAWLLTLLQLLTNRTTAEALSIAMKDVAEGRPAAAMVVPVGPGARLVGLTLDPNNSAAVAKTIASLLFGAFKTLHDNPATMQENALNYFNNNFQWTDPAFMAFCGGKWEISMPVALR